MKLPELKANKTTIAKRIACLFITLPPQKIVNTLAFFMRTNVAKLMETQRTVHPLFSSSLCQGSQNTKADTIIPLIGWTVKEKQG